MNFSSYTSPGPWLHLYDDLPDELEPLMAVVKNLLLHPVDTRRFGIRITPQREQALRQVLTVEQMLNDLFRSPPVSLMAERSPYQRLIKTCDFQAVLFASFARYKGYEIRTRCGFAGYIAPGQWPHHWVNEVRLDDFNARNGHELIHYRWLDPRAPERAPAIFQTAYTQLTTGQIKQLGNIADAMLAEDDEQIAALFRDEKYGAHLIQDAMA